MIVRESRRLTERAALVLTTGSQLGGFIAQSPPDPTYTPHCTRRRYVSSVYVYQMPVLKELESSRSGQLLMTFLQCVGVWWVKCGYETSRAFVCRPLAIASAVTLCR